MTIPPRDDDPIPPWLLRHDHTPDPTPVPDTTRRVPLTPAQIDAALKEFLNTPDYNATRRVLEQQQSVLLNLETLRRLLALLEREEKREQRQMLRLHAELLLLARDRSIDEAWQWLDGYLEKQKREAEELVRAVLNAMTPDERRRFDQIMQQLQQQHLSAEQRAALEEQAQAVLAQVAKRMNPDAQRHHDKPGIQQERRAAMQEYVTAPDWPARFAFLRGHAHELLHTEVIKELQHMAQQTRQAGKLSLAPVFEECARVLEDAKARGIDSAERDFHLRQGHDQGTLRPDESAPQTSFVSDEAGLRPAQASASPGSSAAAPSLPDISLEQVEQIRALVHQPGTFDDSTQQILLAWLGERDSVASMEDIARALRVALQRLG